jgi:acetyl esterase/lipase
MRRPGVEWIRDVAYGASLPGDKGGRNLLDVVRPAAPGERRPALLQIHGGGWVIGDKREQGQPLMTHLAERGWVSFAINYRLSPRATFPDHIVDVKRAIRWIREHAAEYGADSDFLCVTGGSAGGHLTALAAVSANDPRFQPGFEEVDTRLAAAVPFYGVYDFLDRFGIRGSQKMEPFLARTVLKCKPDENRELWEAASPISHVSPEAPPFLLVHGTHDSLVWPEEMRAFERALAEKSRQPVLVLELAGAQHAFDTFHSPRSAHAVRAVTAFLEHVHAQYRDGRAQKP